MRGLKTVKPTDFRAEFIKFSYNQVIKERELENKDKNALMSEINNFSNEAVDDPYKDKKDNRTQSWANRQRNGGGIRGVTLHRINKNV